MLLGCKRHRRASRIVDRLGFELFDKMSWGQTEFDEKVAYQRALEGELERTVKTLSDVDMRAGSPGDANGFCLSRSPTRRQGFCDFEASS